MAQQGVIMRSGDNKRIPGWEECRTRLKGNVENEPMFYVTETCLDFIRTIPILERDDRQWEDIDTSAEDHIADEWRYMLMSRQGKGLSLKDVEILKPSERITNWMNLTDEDLSPDSINIEAGSDFATINHPSMSWNVNPSAVNMGG